jgi:hypothetical protein
MRNENVMSITEGWGWSVYGASASLYKPRNDFFSLHYWIRQIACSFQHNWLWDPEHVMSLESSNILYITLIIIVKLYMVMKGPQGHWWYWVIIFFSENYTVQRRYSQHTRTHLYERTHANPTPMSIFERLRTQILKIDEITIGASLSTTGIKWLLICSKSAFVCFRFCTNISLDKEIFLCCQLARTGCRYTTFTNDFGVYYKRNKNIWFLAF